MTNSIYISPIDIQGINAVNQIANEQVFTEHLNYIDYHFIFFSTLFQSGIETFETNKEEVPTHFLNDPFWESKFVDLDDEKYAISSLKAHKIIESSFDKELDQKYNFKQENYLKSHLNSIFYSSSRNLPFASTLFVAIKDFETVKSRLTSETYTSIINLYKLFEAENVSTVIPKYSVLKKDVKRFEDIAVSSTFRNYQRLLLELGDSSEHVTLNKSIKTEATRLFNKFSSSLDLKKASINFLKLNKKIADQFIPKVASNVGDSILEVIEHLILKEKKMYYYDSKDAFLLRLFSHRLEEARKTVGPETLKQIMQELKQSS